MNQQSPADAIQSIVAQEKEVLGILGDLAERKEAAQLQLGRIRAALEGVQLGRAFAESAAALSTPDPQADLFGAE
jgi:hypothetical protein